MTKQQLKEFHVTILKGLEADLAIPFGARAVVLIAHGSGSSRFSSRNQFLSNMLNNKGIATLLVDLLNEKEKRIDVETKHLRYDIELLAIRFAAATNWITQQPETRNFKIGYFGSSTGAAAALITAARLEVAKAIVTRGGRADLAGEKLLSKVKVPTLFIVGGNDKPIITVSKMALEFLNNSKAKDLAVIEGASHLFEEPGKMQEVSQIAADWFECYLLGRSNKNKFYNKHVDIIRSLSLSSIWDRHAFQIKFKDRYASGELLASLLSNYKNYSRNIIVLGIARGGIVVADALAKKLDADFDIIVSRKLRSPYNLERAIGAMMHDGSVYLDSLIPEATNNVSEQYISMEKLEQKNEIERRLRVYRPSDMEYKIKSRIAILVDDGIATGATMIVAARWVRKQSPKRLIIAAPIAPKKVIKTLRNEADQIAVIRNPSHFDAVEQFYQHFDAISDDQIVQIAKRHINS